LVVVPVDPSEMSVRAAITLLNLIAEDYSLPALLVRTLVNRRASNVARISLSKLGSEFGEETLAPQDESQAPKRVRLKGVDQHRADSPIHLSNATIYRSEVVQNLTYHGRTVFEHSSLGPLQAGYAALARDIE